jgi:nitrous oxide reductase accessory protein NosL
MFKQKVDGTIRLFAMMSTFVLVLLTGCSGGVPAQSDTPKDHGAAGKTPAVEHPIKSPKMYSKVKLCGNCGMMINMWARTRHSFRHAEGDFTYCSIRCVADKEKNSGQPATDVHVALYMHPDKVIPAAKAAYVIGSSAKGTMTMHSKIAFESKENAEQFAAAYGGTVTDYAGALKAAAKELPKSAVMIDQKRKRTGKIKAVTEEVRCVVCNMKVANYPQHDCQILQEDNSSIHFCSTQCLINYFADPGQYVTPPKAPKMTWVKVFPTGDYESALGLYYVVGSKLFGPMGREAIPFRSKQAAEALVSQEGGKVVPFNGLTPQMVSNN